MTNACQSNKMEEYGFTVYQPLLRSAKIQQQYQQQQAKLGREGDLLEIVKETEMSPYWQMIYAQTRICPGKWNA